MGLGKYWRGEVQFLEVTGICPLARENCKERRKKKRQKTRLLTKKGKASAVRELLETPKTLISKETH